MVAIAVLLLVALQAQPAGAQTTARDVEEACDPAPRSGFTDRPEGGLGQAVDCVAHFGVTRGTTATAYEPGGPVSRAQMASFLARAIEVAAMRRPVSSVDRFPDDQGDVHESSINALVEVGVAGGFPDGTYKPRLGVSRQQMASFVARQLEVSLERALPEPAVDHFPDDAGSVHERRINQLADLGVVVGVAPGQYRPGAVVTRGQMALFIARGLDSLTEQDVPLRRIGVTDALAGPELVRASLAGTSGPTTSVRFEFDIPVSEGLSATDFRLYTFTGEQVRSSGVFVDPADARAVIAGFDRAAAAPATTAAVAVGGGASGEAQSPEAGTGLRAISLVSGASDAPDLTSITRLGARVVDFSFDEAATVLVPTGYVLVLDDGTERRSSRVEGSGERTHVVSFDGLTAEEASRVVRGYVEPATVADIGGVTNPQEAVDVLGSGLTSRPDLVGLVPVPALDEVRFTFDEAVSVAVDGAGAPSGAARVYGFSAIEVVTNSLRIDGSDPRTVIATFPDGALDAGVVGGSVDRGSVRSPGGGNAIDEVGLPQAFSAGQTTAPDLVAVGRTATPGRRSVVFVFDQPLVVEQPLAFALYDPEGRRVTVPGCARSVRPERVVCTSEAGSDPETYELIRRAVRAAISRSAVTDSSRSYPSYETSVVV